MYLIVKKLLKSVYKLKSSILINSQMQILQKKIHDNLSDFTAIHIHYKLLLKYTKLVGCWFKKKKTSETHCKLVRAWQSRVA